MDIFLHLPIKIDQMNSEPEIIKHYASMDLDSESEVYLRTHATRFAYLLKMVRKVRANFNSDSVRIMDIGPGFLPTF